METSFKKLLQNAGHLFAGNMGLMVLGFVQGVLITRAMTPSGYGVYGIILSTASTTQAFLGFRTGEPLTQYLVEFRSKGQKHSLTLLLATALMTELITKVLSYVVMCLLSSWVALRFAKSPSSAAMVYIYGLTVPLGFIEPVWQSVARDRAHYRQIAYLPIFESVLKFCVIAVLYIQGWLGLSELIILLTAMAALHFGITGYLLLREIRSAYGIALGDVTARELMRGQRELQGFWRFMWITYLSSMVSTLVKEGDVLILGYFRPAFEVGWYRLAKSLVALVQTVGQSLSTVVYQDFNAAMATGALTETRTMLWKLSKFWVPIVLIGSGVSMALVEPAVRLVYGQEFVRAAPSFRIQVVGTACLVAFFWARPLVLALREYLFNLKLVTIVGLLAFVAMAGAAWANGIIGVSVVAALMWVTIYGGLVWKTFTSTGPTT